MMRLTFWSLSTVTTGPLGLVSSVGVDFPHVVAPGAATGYTVAQAKAAYGWTHNVDQRTIGRDSNGEPVWVKLAAIPTYHNVISQQGIRSQSDILIVDRAGIQLAIVECVADHTVASAVHAHANHEVLAAVLHPSEDPAAVPPALATALAGWSPTVPFTGERATRVSAFLQAQGVPAAWLTTWAQAHPAATPADFYRDLRAWARG
jgi:hypothetical protein